MFFLFLKCFTTVLGYAHLRKNPLGFSLSHKPLEKDKNFREKIPQQLLIASVIRRCDTSDWRKKRFTVKTTDFCQNSTDFLESKNPPASTKNRVRCLKIRLDFQLFRSLVKVRQVLSALLAF